MLTVAQCREYLDHETSRTLSDDEVLRVRNDLCMLARMVLRKQPDEAQPGGMGASHETPTHSDD